MYNPTFERMEMWQQRMIRLASSAIGWDGFPFSVDTTYLEYCLSRNGSAIIVYDSEMDVMLCGQNASTGALDIYGYPENRSVIFRNGQQQWYTPEESVIVFNNSMRKSDIWEYQITADDLANMDMAIRINVNTQKTMPIIPVSQEQALGAKNIYNNLMDNKPYETVDEQSIDVEKFKAALTFDNRRSFTGDNMIIVQREIWNRRLTQMGINNPNVEKRERVNLSETNSNLAEVYTMRRDRLNPRIRAAEEIKKKFGITVTPYFYSPVAMEGGEENGNVYDYGTGDNGKILDNESSE